MKEKEIAHYSKKELWEKLRLSEANRERIEETAKMIPQEVKSIADIGCGSGLFLNYIKDNFKIPGLIGVDFSESAMKILKTSKKVGEISNVPLADDSYDLVSALEVVEHLDEEIYKRAKEELARVSNRYILLSVPFSEDLGLETVRCPRCKNKFNKSHHKRIFNESSMRELLTDQGYECKEVKYISKRNMYFLITPIVNAWRKLRGHRDLSDTVCPVCGYTEKGSVTQRQDGESKGGLSVTTFLKEIWPKKYTYKWIACLYKKID